MYEEGNKNLSLNWGSLLIKLVILAVIVFLAGLIFTKVTGKNSSSNTLASSNSDYITNISTMKTAAFEYFTKSKLPEKVGGTEKLTLAQMVNQKLLIDFTNDGKVCDTNSSYVQATKTADGNYALKVSLTCGKQSDFIVTTIESADVCSSSDTCKNNATNSDVVIDTTTNNNGKTDNNKTVTKGNTGSSSSSSSTSSSSSNSASSSTKSTTTVTVKTTVTVNVSCGSCCFDCGTDTKPTPTPDPTPTPSKVRYYKYRKWSEWSDGYSYEKDAENKSTETVTYNYCKVDTKTIYSTSWVGSSSKSTSYNYELQMLNIPDNVNDLSIVRNSISYFSNNLTDYQAYLNNKYNVYQTGNNFKWDIVPKNATVFRASALTRNNFGFTVQDAYLSGGTYRTRVTINFYNGNGVVPYSSEKGSVYFVPLKFNVTYTDKNTCVRDTESNASKYPGYTKSDKKVEVKWMHRTPKYTWSKETSLAGWEYTGIYEDRNA